jgi:hypothetical protein
MPTLSTNTASFAAVTAAASESEAQALLNTVFGFEKVIGATFNLSALAAVTIADDYVGALASVHRGIQE